MEKLIEFFKFSPISQDFNWGYMKGIISLYERWSQ